MGATDNALQAMPTEQQSGFGTLALKSGAEMAAASVGAQATAMVQARYIMALQRPRNFDKVRQDLLRECKRPSFANNPSAFYRKPIGQGVEGLGIRFVEVAMRCMTNVLTESAMIYEDERVEVHRVTITDLESNSTYNQDIKVTKTVERSKPLDDGSFISVRMNSYNKPVYTIPANDDDLLNKRAALISKAIRTLGLRIIPGDLQDEAEDIIKRTRRDDAAADPDAARKRIVDAFDGLGVSADQLVEYLGHPLQQSSPIEIEELRGLYGAIKDGEATWKSVMDNKAGNDAKKKDEPKGEKQTKSATAKAQQQAAAKAEAKTGEVLPPEQEQPQRPASQRPIIE
jgi:hypothetical protein